MPHLPEISHLEIEPSGDDRRHAGSYYSAQSGELVSAQEAISAIEEFDCSVDGEVVFYCYEPSL